MDKIVIKKERLKAQIEHNRTQHARMYAEAELGYRVVLSAKLKEVLAGLDKEGPLPNMSRIVRDIEAPVNYTKQYDRVLEMISYSAEETIELDSQDFARFVQDDWEWKGDWLHKNSSYSGGKW